MDPTQLLFQIVDRNIEQYGAAHILRELKKREGADKEGITNSQKKILEKMRASLPSAPAAGGYKMPRLMSRKYCKKTPCRRMGFTQRSSCRPYKNCFTARAKRRSSQKQ